MSMYEVRKAYVDDAAGIGEVIGAVWPDSEVNLTRIENVIRNAEHSTKVVSVDGVLAGFADGFMTTALDRTKRWELDLLAVRPQFQRRGMAVALIEANTSEGRARGCVMARGLVAVENVGSQKSFERCGYVMHNTRRVLLVLSSRSHSPSNEDKQMTTSIFPVNTMNYTGFWIEGELNQSNLIQGKRLLTETDYDLVGAVIPENNKEIIHDALKIGYERLGHYQWWERPLINN